MKLTRKAFLAWLREQKPERRFRLSTGNEPLLRWATETSEVYPRMGWSWPVWAERFLSTQQHWQIRNWMRKTITARECIQLLEGK